MMNSASESCFAEKVVELGYPRHIGLPVNDLPWI